MQYWHTISKEELLGKLHTTEKGLLIEEIEERERKYGKNCLKEHKRRNPLLLFFSQFHNILIYILIVSSVVTSLLHHWVDTSVIAGVIIINAIIGFIQEGKAEKALDAISHMLPLQATVIRNGERQTINAIDLVPGDVVLLRAGDKVPADLRLIKTKNLQIQEATLTGESLPITKNTTTLPLDTNLGDRRCMAYSSTVVTYGRGRGIVVNTGEKTEIGRISALVAKAEMITTPLIRQISIFGRWLSAIILLISALTFLIGALLWNQSNTNMLMTIVAIAVAAIPEGLPAIITITLAIGVTCMAKRHAIIRRLPAVETMGSVSTICTDKTGTLTRNELAVQDVATSSYLYHITGSGYHADGKITLNNKECSIDEHEELKQTIRAGLLCNDSEIKRIEDHEYNLEGNPTDNALLILATKATLNPNIERKNQPYTDVIPFESEHKFMASLHHDHQGKAFIYIKGAPEQILEICEHQLLGERIVPINVDYWHKQIHQLASQGKRVVAAAMIEVNPTQRNLSFDDIKKRFTLLGLFALIDPPREESAIAVRKCQQAGIHVKMITGDHAVTACTISKQIGIGNEKVLTGNDINNMTDEELVDVVSDVDIYARTTAEHKLRLVKALQKNNQIVAMTGDGVNDAPALRQANIGIAMGKKGTEAAKEASEMIIADDNFVSICNAVEEGRTIYDNLRKAILYILPTNLGEALIIMLAILFGKTLPITPVQILWINMITAITLALTLAFEPAEEGLMNRAPRQHNESLIPPFLMWRIAFVSIMIVVFSFGLFLIETNIGTDIATARTIAVNMLVAGETVYLFSCRRIYSAAWHVKILIGSRPILIGIGLVILFQLFFTYLPFMEKFFGSAHLGLKHWAYILLSAVVLFFLIEIEKLIMRQFVKKQGLHN